MMLHYIVKQYPLPRKQQLGGNSPHYLGMPSPKTCAITYDTNAEQDPKSCSQVVQVHISFFSGALHQIKFLVQAAQNFQFHRLILSYYLDDQISSKSVFYLWFDGPVCLSLNKSGIPLDFKYISSYEGKIEQGQCKLAYAQVCSRG